MINEENLGFTPVSSRVPMLHKLGIPQPMLLFEEHSGQYVPELLWIETDALLAKLYSRADNGADQLDDVGLVIDSDILWMAVGSLSFADDRVVAQLGIKGYAKSVTIERTIQSYAWLVYHVLVRIDSYRKMLEFYRSIDPVIDSDLVRDEFRHLLTAEMIELGTLNRHLSEHTPMHNLAVRDPYHPYNRLLWMNE